MQYKPNILLYGGMNKDDDPRMLPEGDYIDLLNMRLGGNTEQSDQGLIETLLSNFEIEIGPGTYLGAAVDKENQEIFVLKFNTSDSAFRIFRYNASDDSIAMIYSGDADVWGVDVNTKFFNMKIINRNLIFTDGIAPVRMVNVDRIYESYRYGIGVGSNNPVTKWVEYINYASYPDIIVWYKDKYYLNSVPTGNTNKPPDENLSFWFELCDLQDAYGDIEDISNFNLAAKPPLLALTCEYGRDESRSVNYLKQKTFQFSYRYIYMDYRKSTFAPASLVPIPNNEEAVDGEINQDVFLNNIIRLQIYTGNSDVRAIEVVARDSSDISSWYVITEIQMFNRDNWRVINHDINYYYNWGNDNVEKVIDTSTVYELFTHVPIAAKHMEMLENNSLVFANVVEGYNRISANAEIEISYEDLPSLGSSEYFFSILAVRLERYLSTTKWYHVLKFTLPNTNYGAGTYYISITDEEGTAYNASYAWNGTGTYPDVVRTGLLASITTEGWDSEIWGCNPSDDYSICVFRRPFYLTQLYPEWLLDAGIQTLSSESVEKFRGLKSGAVHSWGIIYRDNTGRISPIIGTDQLKKYIPFPTENSSVDIQKRPILDFYIEHNPPEWADSYEIVYKNSSNISWFNRLIGWNFSKGISDHEDFASAEDDKYFRLKISDPQTEMYEKYPNWQVGFYQWERGDRIRLIGTVVPSAGAYTEYNNVLYDVEIFGVFEDDEDGENSSEYIYFPSIDGIVPAGTSMYVEIYRPKKETEADVYYTTGMTFFVSTDANGNKYHEGDVDQVLDANNITTTEARVRNTSHDIYMYGRLQLDGTGSLRTLYAEGEYISDWYISQALVSVGFPIPELESYKQSALSKRIRHGGILKIDTEVNNIADFEYDKFKDFKDEHGEITGIRLVGFVLKVIQKHKVTSIYIGRRESFSGSGQSDLQFTDAIFGTERPSEENYGSQHPGSICVFNRHLYFWDQSQGVVVRDAANGPEPISRYKMFRFFKDKAKYLDGYSEAVQEVYFEFDIDNEELYCSFGFGLTFETVVFNEKVKRWRFRTDHALDGYISLGKRLFHFLGSNIYEWNRDEGQGYLELSGDTKTAELQLVSNVDPGKIKIFNAIAAYMTEQPNVVQVLIPSEASYDEMETLITSNNWNQVEGIWYGQILMDLNSPGVFPGGDNDKLLNGRNMRGEYCLIKLQTTTSDRKVKIFNFMVLSTPSERSK